MASHPLNFFRLFVLLLLHCLLISTKAFPSYYYIPEEDSVADPSLAETEDIAQYPISLHGYGIPKDAHDQDSLAYKLKEHLLRLRRPSLHGPIKRQQAWIPGYGKRQQDWFATYGKRDETVPNDVHSRVEREAGLTRPTGWNIGFTKK